MILLHGSWDNFRELREKTDLIYTEELRGEEVREKKAPMALFSLAAFLVLTLGTGLSLSVAGLITMLLLIIWQTWFFSRRLIFPACSST